MLAQADVLQADKLLVRDGVHYSGVEVGEALGGMPDMCGWPSGQDLVWEWVSGFLT